jgi:hypothetical protein
MREIGTLFRRGDADSPAIIDWLVTMAAMRQDQMSSQRKRAPRFRVGDRVVFLFGPQKVAGEIVEDRGSLGEYGRRLYRVRINRGEEDEISFEIPEEDIEAPEQLAAHPETPGLRQEFDITYTRTRNANTWTATIKRGELYRGVRAKGAVGYTTGRLEGQKEAEENLGIVTVFLECDQTMCDARSRVRPKAWPEMTDRARRLADQMFKSRHPDAVIEHDVEED